jgi:CRISPR-associated protein Csm5
MRKFLTSSIFRLTAVSPVFVGCGKALNKKEYILPPNGNSVIIPNLHKLYAYLEKNGKAEAYEAFLLKGGNSLFEFLKGIGVRPGDFNQFGDYAVSKGDADIDSYRGADINTFIKDPYGRPYIPGSGLKGALRTALLACVALKNPQKYDGVRRSVRNEQFRFKNGYMRNPAREFECGVLSKLGVPEVGYDGGDAGRDIMRGLRIADSKSLSARDLVLCQKLDVSPRGGDKTINTLRECLKPGVVIEFPVTVDDDLFPYPLSDINKVVAKFSACYAEMFLDKFGPRRNYGERTLYLGGGAGFATKTVVYPLFGAEEGAVMTAEILKNTTPRNHRHENDAALGVSPRMKKCASYGGTVHEFGACKFDILVRTD